jgi:hypothetical protein
MAKCLDIPSKRINTIPEASSTMLKNEQEKSEPNSSPAY